MTDFQWCSKVDTELEDSMLKEIVRYLRDEEHNNGKEMGYLLKPDLKDEPTNYKVLSRKELFLK